MNPTIHSVFESEEALETAYKEYLSLSSFDRTKDASKLVKKLMQKLVNPHPTFHDTKEWVRSEIPDWNIASQVLLNCQEGSISVDITKISTDVEHLKSEEALFVPKVKFKPEEDPEAKEFNRKLATVRNQKLLASGEWHGMNSFRLSPLGSTPALADLNNFSSLSLPGLAAYLPNTTAWVINFDAVASRIGLKTDGLISADGLMFDIYSNSGGPMAAKALVARWLAYQVMMEGGGYVLPRYDSLLVQGRIPESIKEYVVEFKG